MHQRNIQKTFSTSEFFFAIKVYVIHFMARKLVGNGYYSCSFCEFILRCEAKAQLQKVRVVVDPLQQRLRLTFLAEVRLENILDSQIKYVFDCL